MTPFQTIYDAFLSKMLEDEWENWEPEEVEEDLYAILQGALAHFKFPRFSQETTEGGFVDKLTNDEIQILANYMKQEWLNRAILTWENVKPLYEERDFSQANLLDKFRQLLEEEKANAAKLEANYYRSVNKKPFRYRDLASQDVS